jgi:Glycosyl transferase family 2
LMIRRRDTRRLDGRLAAIEGKVDGIARELLAAQNAREAHVRETSEGLGRLQDILQLVYDREPELRERLGHLRTDPLYERAFDEPAPLVSIVIPTYDRGELLLTRAIPSALAQTYQNIEIIVVGDHAPADTERRLAELDDQRITYQNLPYRGPYPRTPRDLWHVAGIPPRNLAVARARGSWIAPLDDDDAFHRFHIERLLDLAKRERHEVAYGLLRCVMNDGTEFPLGTYPPERGQFGWQSAIFHAGLRFFEMELADSLFGSPADWSLCRRMLRAGVRFGMLNEPVADHYESRFSPGDERSGD